MTTRKPTLRELQPGQPVILPSGHAGRVVAVDLERGHVDVEAQPWRANFRPSHLRVEGELVFLNVEAPSEGNQEPEA